MLNITAAEGKLVEKLLASKYEREVLREYVRVLEAGNDTQRAGLLRLIDQAMQPDADASESGVRMREAREALSGAEADWAALVGAQIVVESAETESLHHLSRWLTLALPALDVEWELGDAPVEHGTTRYFGDPDLPADMPWPTLADCTKGFKVSADEIDFRSQCRFVCQIALDDLAQLPGFAHLMGLGMLSVFSFGEAERFGISEVCVKWIRKETDLARRAHPDLDEFNQRLPDRKVRLKPNISLPEEYEGPWSADLEVGDGCEPPDSPASRFGLLGHTRATTGDDPSPGKDWQRLFSLPVDEDEVVWHTVAIRNSDLQRGELDQWRAVWVDMDG
ncbi:MAG: hypothetical protein H6718_36260 [Polyangiaceae bacterium]|nr:hypothetical protein [Myxococcales bacterium]MCB9590916.1 hypothetical protein [Polyangiaceae bacterium]MCB9609624.1 hypothetical protein [Polyangiaceae bacterium]